MRLQVRIIEQAFREDDRLRPHIDKLPFRLRRRRCPEGHVTWTIEADSDLLLLLLDRIELADLLP